MYMEMAQQQAGERPLLVFLIAIFSLIAGVIGLLGMAASYFLLGSLLGGGGALTIGTAFGPAFFFVPINSFVLIVVSIGLFMMRKWALLGFTVLAVVDVLFALYAFATGTIGGNIIGILLVIIGAAVLWMYRGRFK